MFWIKYAEPQCNFASNSANSYCHRVTPIIAPYKSQEWNSWMYQSTKMNVLNYSISNNIKIVIWSINTILIACLPLCLLTCHISVIHIAIFQAPFLVCNSKIRFSLRDIATNKTQYFLYKYKRIIYKTQYTMDIQCLKQTMGNNKRSQFVLQTT